MIEAEIYGMIPSAKMPIRLMAPPVNMFRIPPRPAETSDMKSRSAPPSIPGTGI